MDHEVLSGRAKHIPMSTLKDWLKELKEVARETNKEFAALLGINPSKQLTLVKPSGTVSQLCSTASGIHPRYAPYYLRRVIQDAKDPLTALMREQGIPMLEKDGKFIFTFPIASPEGAITADDIDPMGKPDRDLPYVDAPCVVDSCCHAKPPYCILIDTIS